MTDEQIAAKATNIVLMKIFKAHNPKTIYVGEKITEVFERFNKKLNVKLLNLTFFGLELYKSRNADIKVEDYEVFEGTESEGKIQLKPTMQK